jgi:hypothetical protein
MVNARMYENEARGAKKLTLHLTLHLKLHIQPHIQ